MAKVLRISKTGISVFDATPEERYFDSQWDSLKAAIIGAGSFTFHSGNTAEDLDIAHGLGYAPAFFALAELTIAAVLNYAPLPYANSNIGFPGGLSRITNIYASSDPTNLRIHVTGSAAGADQTFNYKYYIFHNQLDT